MIKTVKIKNFKQFKEFEINGLSLVNLISGKKNVGKSSLLEAIFLLIDHSDPDVFIKLNRFRKSVFLQMLQFGRIYFIILILIIKLVY